MFFIYRTIRQTVITSGLGLCVVVALVIRKIIFNYAEWVKKLSAYYEDPSVCDLLRYFDAVFTILIRNRFWSSVLTKNKFGCYTFFAIGPCAFTPCQNMLLQFQFLCDFFCPTLYINILRSPLYVYYMWNY